MSLRKSDSEYFIEEQERTLLKKQEYDQWLQANDGKIHDAPAPGQSCKIPVGHFLKYSIRHSGSCGQFAEVTFGDEEILKVARVVDPSSFVALPRNWCGGGMDPKMWYVEALAVGSTTVNVDVFGPVHKDPTITTTVDVVA